MTTKFIAYYRVSSQRQGASGLGMEAQERSVQAHVGENAILASYTEIETGKRDTLENRPELRRAIAHAKRSRAVLVVAKMDRLARSVAVTSQLQCSGIDFVACDNPYANRMTIQILAAVAENEARLIATRTKEALASYKVRGGVLGSARPECRRNLGAAARDQGVKKAAIVNRKARESAYEDLLPRLTRWRSRGLTLNSIAARLNAEGHTTRRGKQWTAMQVKRVVEAAA